MNQIHWSHPHLLNLRILYYRRIYLSTFARTKQELYNCGRQTRPDSQTREPATFRINYVNADEFRF